MEEAEGGKKTKGKERHLVFVRHTHTYAQPSANYERRGDMRLHRATLVPTMFVTCYVPFGKHPV